MPTDSTDPFGLLCDVLAEIKETTRHLQALVEEAEALRLSLPASGESPAGHGT